MSVRTARTRTAARRPPRAAADLFTDVVGPAVPAAADAGATTSGLLASVRALGRAVAARSVALDESSGVGEARALTATALHAYWHAKTRHGVGGAMTPIARGGVSPLLEAAPLWAEARALGATAASHRDDVAAYALGTLYTVALPPAVRSRHGAYFTPPPVVDRLLDLAEEAGVDWATARVIDPAAGGGAFVVPVARRMITTLRTAGLPTRRILRSVNRRLRGLELDPFSAWLTQVFLDVLALDLASDEAGEGSPARFRPLVRCCDALDAPDAWDGAADLVIGNPPYGKVPLTRLLRARYGRSLYGHANLYGLFFDLAMRLVRPGGTVAFVTPTSFLGGQYFTRLRALMAAEAPPIALDLIADRTGVFEDVLQETALVTLGREREAGSVRLHFARVSDGDGACELTDAGTFALPDDAGAPWLLPRRVDDVALLHRLADMPHRLSSYGYEVSTGPLVWNRHRAQLTEDASAARGRPLIWAEAILPTGEFRFAATRRRHVPYVRVDDGQGHLVTREPCVLVQRTTAKEQHRRLIAAVLPGAFVREHGGVVVENHVNIVRRRADLACDGGCVSLDALAFLLNSAAVDRVFRCISGSVAVSAYELAAMPLPAPDVLRALDAHVRAGARPEVGEALIATAYGLTSHA